MIRNSALVVLMGFSSLANAQTTSVICTDPSTGTRLEATPFAKPDFYGDTMQVKIISPGKPTEYERFHQLDLSYATTFRGAMGTDMYVDRLVLELGKGSGTQFPNAILKRHQWIYIENPQEHKSEERRAEFKMNCSVAPAPIDSRPCDRTQNQLDQQLLQGAIDKDTDAVVQALSCGANVNAANPSGCTPLMLSAETNRFECGSKSKATDSFLFRRARAIFTTLLDSGAYAVQSDGDGNTVLHKIIRNGEGEMLKELIGLAEDLDVQNNEGMTPLMMAAESGYGLAVKDLVEGGANIELKSNAGKTAYDLGAWLDADTRSLLLAPTVTISVVGQDSGGCSPQSFEVPAGKAVKLKFSASKSKMFMLSIPAANVSLMADGGATVEKTFKIDKPGRYPFQCGVHGGTQTNGTVIAK